MLRKNFPRRKQQRQREAVSRQWDSIPAKFYKELDEVKPVYRHAKQKDIFRERFGAQSLKLLAQIKEAEVERRLREKRAARKRKGIL